MLGKFGNPISIIDTTYIQNDETKSFLWDHAIRHEAEYHPTIRKHIIQISYVVSILFFFNPCRICWFLVIISNLICCHQYNPSSI